MLTSQKRWPKRLALEERGVAGVLNLFLIIVICAIGAVALDVTHMYAARTQLQAAADTGAHSAIHRRMQGATVDVAREDAISTVQFGMPPSAFGSVLSTSDILFGTYDRANNTFQEDPAVRSAALAITRRSDTNLNPVSTFLFRIVGIRQMNVEASAVVETYQPGCLTQGLSSQSFVDLQSGSNFLKGFCVHSNSYVKLGNNNYFESGTVVSMPNTDDLQIGSSGFDQNPGLLEALRNHQYQLRILDRIRTTAKDPLYDALQTPGDNDRPTYIETDSAVLDLGAGANITYNSMSSFTQGRVHKRTCNSSNNTLTLTGPSGGTTYENFVLLTNCELVLSGNVILRNVVLFTTNTSDTSVKVSTAGGGGGSSQGLWVGQNDACAPGNGAQILTRGGFRNSAALYLYGAQIITLGPVTFSSNATGEGAAIISGSTISGSSNLNFTGCPTGMEQNFAIPYFRLAR